jgi:hypothetical protein
MIALNWKEETTSVRIDAVDNQKPNAMSSEDKLSKTLVPLIQIQNSQGDMTDRWSSTQDFK